MTEAIAFGGWLRKQRRALDLTRQVLADQLGCAEITLRRIENGTLKPSKELALILLEKLGIPEFERPQWMLFARGVSGFPTPPAKAFASQSLTNLPASLTSFIGREKEQAEIINHTKKYRLVTLTGPGGVGKTRLSISVGEQVSADYADGIWLVELASLNDPALLPQTVSALFGIAAQTKTSPTEILINFLRAKTMLLILDNCEHLLEACAHLADTLLKNCANLKILATSREALGITGEAAYPVPSLGLPDLKQLLENFREYESVRLFEERAQLAKMNFSLTLENAYSVAQICHRLDGIPLAIELAAARAKLLSPDQIVARLDDRFNLLTSGSRAALPRQQTLRATIDWSHDLLSPPEQIVFRRLAAFVNGWTLASAESVCAEGSIEARHVLDLLAHLADKSLIVVSGQSGEMRYQMLETIREYALEKLSASTESGAVRDRHLEYFCQFAMQFEMDFSTRVNEMDFEYDNLRAALHWAVNSNQTEPALQLACALDSFWAMRGYFSEAREHYTAILALPDVRRQDMEPLRARVLTNAALMARTQSDHTVANSLASTGLALFKKLGDNPGISDACGCLGYVALDQGHYTSARAFFEESLAIQKKLNDRGGVAQGLFDLGFVRRLLGDNAAACRLFDESLKIRRELGFKLDVARSLLQIGGIASDQNDPLASSLLAESLELFQGLGDRWGSSNCRLQLGAIALRQADFKLAHSYYSQALSAYRQLNNRRDAVRGLEKFAELAVDSGQKEQGVRLFGAVEQLCQTYQVPLPAGIREHDAQIIAALVALLGEEKMDTLWTEGHNMSLDQAIEYALNIEARV